MEKGAGSSGHQGEDKGTEGEAEKEPTDRGSYATASGGLLATWAPEEDDYNCSSLWASSTTPLASSSSVTVSVAAPPATSGPAAKPDPTQDPYRQMLLDS